MRFAILSIVVACLAASIIGRQLSLESVNNIPRNERGAKRSLGTGIDTSPLSGPAFGNDTDDDEDMEYSDAEDDSLPESADDALWIKHAHKGNSFLCSLCGTDLGAGYQMGDTRQPPSAASRWTGDVIQRTDWGWFDGTYRPDECDMDYWGMGGIFSAFEISTKSHANGGDVQCFELRHRNDRAENPDGTPMDVRHQRYRVDGRDYAATNAEYFFAMNLQAGVLIGIDLMGPQVAAQRLWGWTPKPDQLPKLRSLSDLYWGYWSWQNYMADTHVDNINAYVVYGVQNPETERIAARAVRSRGFEMLQPWPGQYFPVETVEGLALLGSPIGATIGYFLMQHKKEIGNKYVTGIHVLRNDKQIEGENEAPDLVFYITDVPPERLIPDMPEHDPPQGQPHLNAPSTSRVNHHFSRGLAGHSIEEHVLGPRNILRNHTIMAR